MGMFLLTTCNKPDSKDWLKDRTTPFSTFSSMSVFTTRTYLALAHRANTDNILTDRVEGLLV